MLGSVTLVTGLTLYFLPGRSLSSGAIPTHSRSNWLVKSGVEHLSLLLWVASFSGRLFEPYLVLLGFVT